MSQPSSAPRYMCRRPPPITIDDSRTTRWVANAPRPPAIERVATSIEFLHTPLERSPERRALDCGVCAVAPPPPPPSQMNAAVADRAPPPRRRTLPPAARAALYEIVANLWVGLVA